MFNWIFNRFYFLSRDLHHSRDFPGVTSAWGVSAVAILYSSVNCVCVWSTKKLTMPANCVAAICNNSAPDDPRYNNARAPTQSSRSEAKVD